MMAFIPNKCVFSVGDKVTLAREVSAIIGTFEKGTVVTISDINPYRGYSIKDDLGNELIECGWELFEKV